MKTLQGIAEEAANGIDSVLTSPLSAEQKRQVEEFVEKAVIKGLLEGQHRAVDAALHCPDADQDLAHKIATAIRQKNDALIANLSALR